MPGHFSKSNDSRDSRNSQVELRAHIERIVFTNEENGFTVAKVIPKGGRNTVTVVGVMHGPTAGQEIVAMGEWQTDPRFGEQFKASSCRCELPATANGVRLYLQSGMVRGIGAKYAGRIVERFGDKTIEVLDNEPDRLREVEGIGPKRLEQVKQAWGEHQEIRGLMLFLQSHEVSAAYAVKIFKHYGAEAVNVVRDNPYRLAMDIHGVGFLTADRIAVKLGFPKDSPLRAEAGVIYTLGRMAEREGHLYAPYGELMGKCGEVLEAEEAPVAEAVESLVAQGMLVVEQEAEEGNESVYLKNLHISECGAASRLQVLMAAAKTVRPIEADKAIHWVQTRLGISLAPKQEEAVRRAAESKILVVTGGPGTGKTTIINAILRIFDGAGAKMLLAAPTGRAAKRMAEATGQEAKTLHRLLEFSPQQGRFLRNEDDPLHCDLLVVDEASMVDMALLHHLLKAVPLGATLVLVGDVDQLPSVGPGNVLKEVIDSGVIPVVLLTDIFRQARESDIVINAHAINRGVVPSSEAKEDLGDFFFIRRDDPEEVLELILEMVSERIPKRFGLDPVRDIQVLTPMHKGITGAENLNARLRQTLNPGRPELIRGNRIFSPGDKVMQIRNNYDKDVFNGDIGRIVRMDVETGEAVVLFDDREVEYDRAELDEIIPAYAVSVHKSQGSEYPAVVMPVLTQHYVLLQRNLLYTAVTRGRKLVVLIGSSRAMSIAVGNNSMHDRYTKLARRLRS